MLASPVAAADQSPNKDAQIKNITFSNPVTIGSTITIDVTVQNDACGILGADLVVVLKGHDTEIARQNAYVFRYFSKVKTFSFKYTSAAPARSEFLLIELYWNNFGKMILQDTKQTTLDIIEKTPTPSFSPTPAKTATPILTPTPKITSSPTPTPPPSPLQPPCLPYSSYTIAPTPTISPIASPSPLPTITLNATQLPNVTITPTPPHPLLPVSNATPLITPAQVHL